MKAYYMYVTPTDRPKSVRNRYVIEVFGGVCVLSFGFRIFCWYRGFCHRTESDLIFFSFSMYNKYVLLYACATNEEVKLAIIIASYSPPISSSNTYFTVHT